MAFVPDDAVYSAGEISHAAFKLFVCYCAHRNNSDSVRRGLSWPSRDTVHKETGICRTYISTLKKELADAGWIEIVSGKIRPLRGFTGSGAGSNLSALRSNDSTAQNRQKVDNRTPKSNDSTRPSSHPIGKSNSSTAIKEEPAKEPLQEPADEPSRTSSDSSPQSLHLRDLLFEVLAEACAIDMRVCTEKQRGELYQTVRIFREARCTPDDVRKVRAWWSTHDWRGKRGDIPTLAQLREVWGKAAPQATYHAKFTSATTVRVRRP